jgi:hypothetical protein
VRLRAGLSVVSSSEPRFLGCTARSLVTISSALRQLLLAVSASHSVNYPNSRVHKTSTPLRSEVTAHLSVVVDIKSSGPASKLFPNIGCPDLHVGDFPVPRIA